MKKVGDVLPVFPLMVIHNGNGKVQAKGLEHIYLTGMQHPVVSNN
jgi:hypothetical protein